MKWLKWVAMVVVVLIAALAAIPVRGYGNVYVTMTQTLLTLRTLLNKRDLRKSLAPGEKVRVPFSPHVAWPSCFGTPAGQMRTLAIARAT